MDLANPAAPFLSAKEARVLRALSRTTSGLTGRKVAALAAVPASTTRRILEGFTALGVVTVTPLGPSYAYAVNVEHIAWPTVRSALDTRERLCDRWAELVTALGPPGSDLVLFGSGARGDGTATSDIDLLLVTPDGEDADELIGALGDRTWAWTGRNGQVYHLSRSELADHVRRGDPLVAAWREDGVRIAGRSVPTLLRSVA